MRLQAVTLAAGLILAGCATGTGPGDSIGPFDSFTAPSIGTMVTLKSVAEGEPDSVLRQLVVAAEEDYVIYANLLSDGLTGESDYFIEYSGIYWQDCSLAPLSEDDRADLKAMWPLTPGAEAQVEYLADGVETLNVTIEEFLTATVEGYGEQPVATVVNSVDDQPIELSKIAPALGVSVRVDWGRPGTEEYIGYDVLTSLETVDLADYGEYVAAAAVACLK